VRRREFLGVVGGAAAWPIEAGALFQLFAIAMADPVASNADSPRANENEQRTRNQSDVVQPDSKPRVGTTI
jgi:hypothetical protein